MRIASLILECVVTQPVVVRNERGEYQLAAAIHGALGRELSRPDTFPEGLFKRAGTPAPIILRRALFDSNETVLSMGQPVDLEFMCFGDSTDHCSIFAEAISLALARGVGGPAPGEVDRGRMAIVSCRFVGAPVVPDGSHAHMLSAFSRGGAVRFWSPAALKWNPDAQPFSHLDLAKAIFQRVACALAPAYGGDLAIAPREAWEELEFGWLWSTEDRWTPHLHDGRATRQAAYRGVVGELQIVGDLRPVLETLWWGSWTGIGEGTAIGLGQYSLLSLGR